MKKIYYSIILLCSLSLSPIHAMEEGQTFLHKVWTALQDFCNPELHSISAPLNKAEIRQKKYILFNTNPLNEESISRYIAELQNISLNTHLTDEDDAWLLEEINRMTDAIHQKNNRKQCQKH